MFEPLAASVRTSIFPSRPLSSQLFASNSPFGMAIRTAKPPLPSDFFTPHPWSAQVKGKGRALPEGACVACSGPVDGGCIMTHKTVIREYLPSFSARAAKLKRMVVCPRGYRGSFYDEPRLSPSPTTPVFHTQAHSLRERESHPVVAHLDEAG